MPIFTYICDNGHTHDDVAPDGRVPKICPECSMSASRLFKMPQLITMESYITRAGDGIPTEIRSPEQERAYEKQHGIAHLTDKDMKDMRDGLTGQKARIQKREEDKLPPMRESYEKAVANLDKLGTEYKKEVHEMATAIE